MENTRIEAKVSNYSQVPLSLIEDGASHTIQTPWGARSVRISDRLAPAGTLALLYVYDDANGEGWYTACTLAA